MARELTEDEADELAGCGAEHTNLHEEFCCPHCLRSSPHKGVKTIPVAVTCPSGDCKREFVAWRSVVEISASATLPEAS